MARTTLEPTRVAAVGGQLTVATEADRRPRRDRTGGPMGTARRGGRSAAETPSADRHLPCQRRDPPRRRRFSGGSRSARLEDSGAAGSPACHSNE